MEYEATSKYIRMSTRKLRLIADAITRLDVNTAIVQLSQMPKRAADPMQKTLASAIANAKVKEVASETLRIKTIEVMGGPAMKRFHAASRGMAHAYKKRMSHVRILLTDEINKENTKNTHGGKS